MDSFVPPPGAYAFWNLLMRKPIYEMRKWKKISLKFEEAKLLVSKFSDQFRVSSLRRTAVKFQRNWTLAIN